jgi:tetratricopeptide (TPR) repeat protein
MGSEDDTLAALDSGTTEGSSANLREAPRLVRGQTIDRYVVLDTLGSGAMGVVYLAYDPDLDRRVALKLLQRDGGDANARMLREARAMARLSHPNVVAVHDVGEHDGLVWIAMELVEGGHLRAWLRADERSWQECLDTFRQAAEGLAAAHEAGLVHRDFKPDNVLISARGRVLVTDFGLARASGHTTTAGLESSSPDALALTMTGAISGTPAYMSPEQFAGRPAGPASDQFAFCIALYEALYGERPFPAETLPELSAKVSRGEFTPPANVRLPSWLRAVITRGLAVDPAARFESMRALLDALDRAGGPARRGVLAVGGLVVVTGLLVAATRSAPGPTCDGGVDRLAEVWDESRAQTIATAFGDTKIPYAPATFERVRARIDAWTPTWSAAHQAACEATHVRGEQSEARLDARMTCLSGQLQRVSALVDELAAPDEALVDRAERAVGSLPDPTACADPNATEPAADDPATRARLALAREHLAVAMARNEIGRYEKGVEAADDALAALGDLATPVRVEVLATQGQLQHRAGDPQAAVTTLQHALEAHAVAPAPYSAAEAWLQLVMVTGDTLAQTKEARALLFPAQLAVTAAEAPALQRQFHSVAGSVLLTDTDADGAIEHLETAIALAETAEADDQVQDVLQGNYGNALYTAGRYEDAKRAYRAGLAAARRAWGDDHPAVAMSMANLGRALTATAEYDEAKRLYEASLAMRVRLLGPRHHRVAESHLNLSAVLLDLGQREEALTHAQAALDIWSETLEPDHPYIAIVHNNLGTTQMALGNLDEALEHFRTGETLVRARYGSDSIRLATPLANQANLHLERQAYAEALAIYDRVLQLRIAAQGADHPDLAYALVGKARALLGLGRAAEAVAPADRARVVREAGHREPAQMYLTYITLADAMAQAGDDPARAQAYAEQARAAFGQTGLDWAEAKELSAFDAAHAS